MVNAVYFKGDKRKMTKLEALAKDCIENHTHRLVDKPTKQDIYLREESIFIQGYRQSEKKIADLERENAVLIKRIERAKECMKKLLFIINSDPANYNCKGLVQDAEDFIYNRICNIRQQGQHCISETRCIMCDK